MIGLLGLFAVVGFALVAFGRRLGRTAFLVGAVAPLAATAWTAVQLPRVVDGRPVVQHMSWVGALDLGIDLRLDGLAATMTLIVAVVGVLVLVYARSYFDDASADLGRLAGLLVLFAGAMLAVVQADHLLVLYAGWELTTIASYLLIGNRHTDADARAAALHALLVTGAGGLAMLGGFVLLGHSYGTYRLSEILAMPLHGGPAVAGALVLILLGAFTKSAQYPFHAWLPGAMAAPTPVSTYLHSATMVKAGVYLIARLAPVFAGAPVWRPLVLTAGATTMVLGGLRALRQNDLKLLLAFGTVSQLGLMVVLFGAGTPEATRAGWVLLVAHALFKAALFMVVGVLDVRTGTRDVRRLPPLDRRWLWLEVAAGLSAASMAGVPLLLGFISKEAAYSGLLDGGFAASGLLLAAAVVGSMLTVAYSARFQWGAFVTARRRRSGGIVVEGQPDDVARPGGLFGGPAAVLAGAALVLGVAPGLLDRLASASLPGRPRVHLELWHGPGPPLALSAVTFLGGGALFAWNRRTQRVLAAGAALPSGEAAYLVVLRGLAGTARRVTAFVQNGSLPVYAGVILATAALVPGVVLLDAGHWPGWPRFATRADVPVAAMLVAGATGAAVVRRRFSAAVLLGATGYAMAGLFVVYGAPDLALTQVAVETLTTVVFVLVLRRLPDRFERQSSARRRVGRALIATAVAASVFAFALVAGASRTAPPTSGEMVERAVPDGHGHNVVNVILVDFRGLDTMGEITVLAVASLGAVALARVGRRAAAEAGDIAPEGPAPTRIVFVDVSVRATFHVVLMMSLWLLFAGHNHPGGGFVGGLLAGSAIALRYVAGGIAEVRGRSRFRPWTVLGTGLLLSALTATYPLLRGRPVLDVASHRFDLPLLGHTTISTALVFDIGVYLTVVGMVLMAFEAFGDPPVETAGEAGA